MEELIGKRRESRSGSRSEEEWRDERRGKERKGEICDCVEGRMKGKGIGNREKMRLEQRKFG